MNSASIEDVTEFVLDGTHGSPARTETGIPVLSAQNVKNGVLDYDTDRYTSDAEYEAFKRRLALAAGDVLLTIVGTIGRAAVVDAVAPLVFQRSVAVLRPRSDRLSPRFLYHVIQSQAFQAQLSRSSNQSSQAGVYLGKLKKLRIPLPPLPEQRRIAEILDKADALRAKRRAALAQFDTLTQSIFLDMFGDPATNPKRWPIKRIAEISECLDRLRRPVTESDRKPGNVPYYGANGQQGWIDTALFDEPLVLVAEDGGHFDTPERGVAYRIDGPAWVNNHAHILRARPEYVETEFLHRALRHFNFIPYISGTTRAKLTQGQLNSAKLIVPPLHLQRAFSERVAAVQRTARTAARSGEQLEALFTSLQCRIFRSDMMATAAGEAHGVTTAGENIKHSESIWQSLASPKRRAP